MDPVTGVAPVYFHFIDASTGGVGNSYYWEFGDGTSSREHEPTHKYNYASQFTVYFTVTNSSGSSTVSHQIRIDPPGGGAEGPLADWRKPTSCSIHRCYAAETFLRPLGVVTIPYYDDLRYVHVSGPNPSIEIADAEHPSFGYAYLNSISSIGFLLFEDRPGGNPSDGTFEIMLRHVEAKDDPTDTVSVVFRFTDINNYYMARLTTSKGLELWKCVAGTMIQMALVEIGAAVPTSIYQMRIRMEGETILVYLNNMRYIALSDESHSGGSCGVGMSTCRAEVYRMVWYDESPTNKMLGWMPFVMTGFSQEGESNTFITPTMANLGIFGAQAGTLNKTSTVEGTILHGMSPVDYLDAEDMRSAITCLEYLRASGYVVYILTPTYQSIGHLSSITYPEPGAYVKSYADFKLSIIELWG
jgi:PKD repeat protein